jgi:uncharacterized Rossmann fold enzyme
MEFKDWEPHYCEILEYFGFDRAGDEKAAKVLASLMSRDNLLSLAALTCDNPVTVCGNAPCLKDGQHQRCGICRRCSSRCS